jgi:hypothetical protein
VKKLGVLAGSTAEIAVLTTTHSIDNIFFPDCRSFLKGNGPVMQATQLLALNLFNPLQLFNSVTFPSRKILRFIDRIEATQTQFL